MPRTFAQWTGVAVTAIVVSGSDVDLLLAVPLGIMAGALATFFSRLAERARESRRPMIATVLAVLTPFIGRARGVLSRIPHVRALGACVLALFVGIWIGNFMERGRAIERESAAVAKAVAKAVSDEAEHARVRQNAAVSEALLNDRNETKRQLDEAAAAAHKAADTIASDSKRRVDRVCRAARAALEEETELEQEPPTNGEWGNIDTTMAEDRDILRRSCRTERTDG